MTYNEYKEQQPDFNELLEEGIAEKRKLLLHNDEVHTFDYVIESLIEVCDMDSVQAEQCTFLVHYKGKCDVKRGSFDFLKPFKDGLIDRGLEATID